MESPRHKYIYIWNTATVRASRHRAREAYSCMEAAEGLLGVPSPFNIEETDALLSPEQLDDMLVWVGVDGLDWFEA